MSFQPVKKPFSEIKVKSTLLTMGGRLSAVIDGRERGRTAVYWVRQGLETFGCQQQLGRERAGGRVCPEGLSAGSLPSFGAGAWAKLGVAGTSDAGGTGAASGEKLSRHPSAASSFRASVLHPG